MIEASTAAIHFEVSDVTTDTAKTAAVLQIQFIGIRIITLVG